jgi:hypothetical protein
MLVPTPALVTFFVTFHSIGGIGNLLLLILVAWNPNIPRHATWYNFCASWVLYSITFLLLTLTGHQDDRQPPFGICLTQAALTHAVPVLASLAMLSLVLQLWCNLKLALRGASPGDATSRTFVLVVVPYVVSFVIFLVALMDGASHIGSVRKNYANTQCSIKTDLPDQVVSVTICLVFTVTVPLEVFVGLDLYQNWKVFRGLGSHGTRALSALIRIASFTLFCLLSIFVCLFDLSNPTTLLPTIFITLVPVISFLNLGTQTDIIRGCMFWKSIPDPMLLETCDPCERVTPLTPL